MEWGESAAVWHENQHCVTWPLYTHTRARTYTQINSKLLRLGAHYLEKHKQWRMHTHIRTHTRMKSRVITHSLWFPTTEGTCGDKQTTYTWHQWSFSVLLFISESPRDTTGRSEGRVSYSVGKCCLFLQTWLSAARGFSRFNIIAKTRQFSSCVM